MKILRLKNRYYFPPPSPSHQETMSSDHAMPPMGHQDLHGRDGVSSNNNRSLVLLRDIICFTHNSTTGKDNTKSSKLLLRRYIDTNDEPTR